MWHLNRDPKVLKKQPCGYRGGENILDTEMARPKSLSEDFLSYIPSTWYYASNFQISAFTHLFIFKAPYMPGTEILLEVKPHFQTWKFLQFIFQLPYIQISSNLQFSMTKQTLTSSPQFPLPLGIPKSFNNSQCSQASQSKSPFISDTHNTMYQLTEDYSPKKL